MNDAAPHTVHILVAPNALKGSLTAAQAAQAIASGLSAALPGARITMLPIADGGDGTAEMLSKALEGQMIDAEIEDPLGRIVTARWGLLDTATAVIDCAAASGLALLSDSERDPLHASSFGTGQLALRALERGVSQLILGVGGTATVDGGSGLLEALGVRLLDAGGTPVVRGGAGLEKLSTIDTSRLDRRARDAQWTIACDVKNPLLGPQGAATVFGPQKGASRADVQRLERGLKNLADVLDRDFGVRVHDIEFTGAAGGIAAALHAVLGARLVSGIELVLDTVDFERCAKTADWVITAEGKFDLQSLEDKGPWGVARTAFNLGKPVVLMCGAVDDAVQIRNLPELTAIIGICERPLSTEEAMARAADLLERTAERFARFLVRRSV